MSYLQRVARVKKRFYGGDETAEDVEWIFKEIESVVDLKLQLKKLQHDAARSEYIIDSFAFKNNLNNFRGKWSEKNFNNSDFSLANLIEDFLGEIEEHITKSPESQWF